MRMNKIPEKSRLLGILKDAGFDVPDFLFMSGEDFDKEILTNSRISWITPVPVSKLLCVVLILWRFVSSEGHLIHWRQTVM